MPRRKGQKDGGASAPVQAPLKGALREEGETAESTALQLILQSMEYQQKQQQEMMATFQASLTQQAERIDQMWAEFDAKMVKERQAAADGMAALNERLEELLKEQQTMTPRQIQELEKQMTKEAMLKNEEARKEFLRFLETCPKGEVVNDTGEVTTLSINGIKRVLRPGKNKVESPFVDAWEEHLRIKKEGAEFTEQLRMRGSPLDANKMNLLQGKNPIWHQDHGGV